MGALCPKQWHVADGRVTHKGHLAVLMNRFEDSRPDSSVASSNISSVTASAVNTDAEGDRDMKVKVKKKAKKLTRAQMNEEKAETLSN